MGKIFKFILDGTLYLMTCYNSIKKTFKTLFTNEKSN